MKILIKQHVSVLMPKACSRTIPHSLLCVSYAHIKMGGHNINNIYDKR